MDEDGGRRGEREPLQKAAVHHVEWREGPGQRKRKKRAGEDAEHQGRVIPDSKILLQTLSKLVRHEDSPQCLAMETDF